MDPALQDRLRQSLAVQATRWGSASPLYAAICQGCAAALPPGLVRVYDRFLRTASHAPSFTAALAALHHLALAGRAPDLAPYFPSCGGRWPAADPLADPAAIAAAVAGCFAAAEDDILTFLLGQPPVDINLAGSTLVLLGALGTARRFGGGVSVVELGAGSGMRLLFDRYAYRIGGHTPVGTTEPAGCPTPALAPEPANVVLQTDLAGGADRLAGLLSTPLPPVSRRLGLDRNPTDLRDPAALRLAIAFIPPDQPQPIADLRAAARLMTVSGRPDVRAGSPATDLAPLLAAAYAEMPPGQTLLLVQIGQRPGLGQEGEIRVVRAVQGLAVRLEPNKPLAWLQAEPPAPGADTLDVELHTFGWADAEDRAILPLATADRHLRWLR